MENKINLRIHPAIGMARVGNSEDYYIAPETMAGRKGENGLTGGLPIKKGQETQTITSDDIRDTSGQLKRQAARFKIFQYDNDAPTSYPSGAGTEVIIGSVVNGKKVVDIAWTVHLANKKANCWSIDEDANQGIELYENGAFPPIRNPQFAGSNDPSNKTRLQKLVIDPGPRAIKASNKNTAEFKNGVMATYWDSTSGTIKNIENYPQSFPGTKGNTTGIQSIESLGEILTEDNGRLLVLGGFGKACGFNSQGDHDPNAPLNMDVDNNNWLDDTSDGPVKATVIFDDGSKWDIPGSAWVVSTDPSYAPQTLNVVSLWDDIFTNWLENMNLDPEIYSDGKYQPSFKPHFEDEVAPTLLAAHLQMWNTNLPQKAIQAHRNMSNMGEQKPSFNIMSYIRNPNLTGKDDQTETGSPLMPLSLGDSAKGFLTVSKTQYFFLSQWANGMSENAPAKPLGPGEFLDKATLVNCLGGRFSPGIDMTFIARDPNLFNQDWKNPAIGPFRINAKHLDYAQASQDNPFLGVGYTPLRTNTPVEPGDISKFMAIPWHTDYNSCATHIPAPNPGGDLTPQNAYSGTVNTSLFWSWPAQRPVAVYTFDDLVANNGKLPVQRYSLRGKGTAVDATSTFPATEVGRFQSRLDILDNWNNIGVIIQGPAIENYPDNFDKDYYLEVKSNFKKDESNLVVPWPNTATDKNYPPKS
ncbi:MAG: LodA/GoxA family CTQ-dependent oxidase [Saprospiraceae bacterium]|nr:LodA/GoxA family CTQ-dependent oxidase [Saprospiraceae bacterium]MCB9322636.1 hypothetical protein [Lewinellaceae bacterium]